MELPKKIIKLKNIVNTIFYNSNIYASVEKNLKQDGQYNFIFHDNNSTYKHRISYLEKENLEEIVLLNLVLLRRKYSYIESFSSSIEYWKMSWKGKKTEQKEVLSEEILEQQINKIKEKEKIKAQKIEQFKKQEKIAKKDVQKSSLDSKQILIWLLIIGFWIFAFSGVIWPDKTDYSNGRTLDCRKPENTYQCELLEQEIYESQMQQSPFDRLPY